MKIDRDHFRYLTGFGRDTANFVARVFDELKYESLPVGNLVIRHDQDRNDFAYEFMPFVDDPDSIAENLRDKWLADDTAAQMMLSIWIDSSGFREVTSLSWYMLNPLSSSNAYHVYQHTFVADQNRNVIEGAKYTGVTKRGWRTRWTEHLRAAESGSTLRFHQAIRQWHGVATIVMHDIVGSSPSEQGAMELEEFLVERDSLYPHGLNMIPGGYAGLAYLRRIGAIGKHERIGVDDVDGIINRFFDRATRKGLPNPLAAANWLNADYAEKVICAGPDRLKPQQIREARFFSSLGQDIDTITARVGARNVAQMERLLSGQTYSRIQ